jgi:hypothetical protein
MQNYTGFSSNSRCILECILSHPSSVSAGGSHGAYNIPWAAQLPPTSRSLLLAARAVPATLAGRDCASCRRLAQLYLPVAAAAYQAVVELELMASAPAPIAVSGGPAPAPEQQWPGLLVPLPCLPSAHPLLHQVGRSSGAAAPPLRPPPRPQEARGSLGSRPHQQLPARTRPRLAQASLARSRWAGRQGQGRRVRSLHLSLPAACCGHRLLAAGGAVQGLSCLPAPPRSQKQLVGINKFLKSTSLPGVDSVLLRSQTVL